VKPPGAQGPARIAVPGARSLERLFLGRGFGTHQLTRVAEA